MRSDKSEKGLAKYVDAVFMTIFVVLPLYYLTITDPLANLQNNGILRSLYEIIDIRIYLVAAFPLIILYIVLREVGSMIIKATRIKV